MFVLGNIRLYFFYSYYDVIGWFKILIIPVFSIYSGFVLHLLKSKKKRCFSYLHSLYNILVHINILALHE